VYSQIGLVMLIGLISKNGILIVDFTNQLRDRGMEKVQAVADASARRLRPILMTSAATVLGAVPLAVATGAGAESRSAIGWVVVGGVAIGTLFTLFVIPVAYTYIVGDRQRIVEEGAGGAAAVPPGAPAAKA
jgi:multidrug efflux pump